MNDFTTTFTVDASPQQVFDAIRDVRGWWTGDIEGDTRDVGDVFIYRYGDLHRSVQRITDAVPGKRVAWHVDDADLSFVDDSAEWTGTDVTFDIAQTNGATEVRFAHVGLTPDIECFEACSTTWGSYINGSLRSFIGDRVATVA